MLNKYFTELLYEKENYPQLCRRCINTIENPTKLVGQVLRYLEQKICNVPHKCPQTKTKK